MRNAVVSWYSKVENRVVVWAMVTVLAIVTNLVMISVLTTYIISTEMHHQQRTGRLASTINRAAENVNRELRFMGEDLEQVKIVNRHPWTRNNMAEFCIEAEKINKDFICPDVIKLAPDFDDVLRERDIRSVIPQFDANEP